MTIIQVKRLYADSKLPTQANEDDAGWDLYAHSWEGYGGECVLYSGARTLIKTGIAVAIPEGFFADIRPRSGLALKDGLTVLNTPGTIDAGYRNELGVILINHNKGTRIISKGDRIAQFILRRIEPVKWEVVEELDETERGQKGFGSSGK